MSAKGRFCSDGLGVLRWACSTHVSTAPHCSGCPPRLLLWYCAGQSVVSAGPEDMLASDPQQAAVLRVLGEPVTNLGLGAHRVYPNPILLSGPCVSIFLGEKNPVISSCLGVNPRGAGNPGCPAHSSKTLQKNLGLKKCLRGPGTGFICSRLRV